MEEIPTTKTTTSTSRLSWMTGISYLGWLAVGCIATVTMTGFLADWWWVFDLTCHFRTQYFVAATALFMAALAFRRFTIAVAAAAILIVNLCLLIPFYYPSASSTELPADLRLMVLNVQSANRQYARVRELIGDASPDVIMVLEFNEQWRSGLEEIEVKYPFSEHAPRSHSFGIAVYSRLPFRRVSVIEISQQQLPAIEASIDIDGQCLTVLGVHVLPPVSRSVFAQRNAQLRDIANLVHQSHQPVIVAGDLNCTTWSPFLGRLIAETGLVDSRRGRGLQATWPTFMPWMMIPIDHCLTSPSLVVLGRHVTPSFGSDHLGIVVDLKIRGEEVAGP